MSNKFNGFTVDEIHNIHSKSEHAKKPNGGTVRKHTIRKLNGDSKGVDKSAKSDANAREDATSAVNTSDLSESTIQAFQDALHFKPLSAQSQAADDSMKCNEPNANMAPNQITNSDSAHDLDSRALFQGISLKDFEKHHNLMKEANLEKRRLLSNAIEQRFEQSIAEATKIAKIREELDKLDQELAADVEILRKEIEAVTIQYTATRENYNQIESQFLAAKLNLHQISEKKEMLTEHLCTIISHNEDRKAKKLTELIDKVGIATDSNGNAN